MMGQMIRASSTPQKKIMPGYWRFVWVGLCVCLYWSVLGGACGTQPQQEGSTPEASTQESGGEQSLAEVPATEKSSGDSLVAERPTPPQDASESAPEPTIEAPAAEPSGPDSVTTESSTEAVVPEQKPEMVAEQAPDTRPPTPTKFCAPLPAATGTIVRVTPTDAAKLPQIVASAKAGTTILLADGVYKMSGNESQRRINFRQPNVTLRSASGDPTKVTIDGEYKTEEMLFVNADDVTIAEITIRRAKYHLIHVTGKAGHTKGTRMYRLRLLDGGQQFVKVNSSGQGQEWADDGRVECSDFEMTSAGRPNIESRFGGCYTGGVDAHGAKDWIVRYNTFKGIYCTNGSLAEHAIHFWRVSRGTLVERNIIINCARGIGFGLGKDASSGDRKYPDDPYPQIAPKGHIDGIIRNNVIHTDAAVQKHYDTGIELEQAYNVVVVHNTLASASSYTGLSYRFANTKAVIQNNLLYRLSLRDGAKGTVSHNLTPVPAGYFVDMSKIDYHLEVSAVKAIGQGTPVPQAGLDLDGQAHSKTKPDLGAYAY